MHLYRKEFYKLLLVDTLLWSPMACAITYVNSYYAQNNVSPFMIGVLATIAPVSAILYQPLWASLSDRTKKHRIIMQFAVVMTALACLLYLLGVSPAIFLFATVVMQFFHSAIIPLSEAIITKTAIEKKTNYAIIRMGGTIGYAIVVLAIGGLLDNNPSYLFIISAIMYLSYAASTFFLPKTISPVTSDADQQQSTRKKTATIKDTLKNMLRVSELFGSKDIKLILMFAFIIFFGLSFYNGFMPVYFTELGHEKETLGKLFAVSAMSEVPLLLFVPRIEKRIKPLGLLCFAAFVVSVRLFLVSTGSFPALIVSQVMHGATFMTTYYTCVMFISRNVKDGFASQGISIYTMIQMGFGSMSGNLAGGIISNMVGFRAAFILIGAIMLLSAMLGLGILIKRFRDNPAQGCSG